MKLRIAIAFICLLVGLSGCHDDDDSIPVSGSRTVLVYMVGQNTLSSFVSKDLDEMKEGIKEVDVTRNNLLVYIDDYSTTRLIRLGKDKKGRVVEETVATYKEQNSLDVSVMKEILNTAFNKYPAENYGITFWSHGDGWIPSSATTRWFGQDGNDYMNIPDLHEALKVAPHFDFIFFDACFMESVEVAYELRDRGDYIISSPTEIPGPGAPYQEVVPAMFAGGDAQKIAEAYFSYYNRRYDENKENSNTEWTGGVSVAALKTAVLEDFAAVTRTALSDYVDEIPNLSTSAILCYDPYRKNNYWDVQGLIQSLVGKESDLYTQWEQVFNQLFVFAKSTPKNYCTNSGGYGKLTDLSGFSGLSIYIPKGNSSSRNNTYYRSLEWSKATDWGQMEWQ